MADNSVWAICERVAEVHALLDDHVAGGKHSTADVVAKAQAVLSEPELLRARCSMLLPAEHAAPGGQARSRGRLELTKSAGPDTRGRHRAIKAKRHETRL